MLCESRSIGNISHALVLMQMLGKLPEQGLLLSKQAMNFNYPNSDAKYLACLLSLIFL